MSQRANDRSILIAVLGAIAVVIFGSDPPRIYALTALMAVIMVATRPEPWMAIGQLVNNMRELQVFGVLKARFGGDPNRAEDRRT